MLLSNVFRPAHNHTQACTQARTHARTHARRHAHMLAWRGNFPLRLGRTFKTHTRVLTEHYCGPVDPCIRMNVSLAQTSERAVWQVPSPLGAHISSRAHSSQSLLPIRAFHTALPGLLHSTGEFGLRTSSQRLTWVSVTTHSPRGTQLSTILRLS